MGESTIVEKDETDDNGPASTMNARHQPRPAGMVGVLRLVASEDVVSP